MQTYRVEKYFQWGQLNLDKKQLLEVYPDPDDETSLWVRVAGTDKKIRIGNRALDNFVEMGLISVA